MRRFGITFDLQDPGRPDTVEHAAAYVRTGAAFVGAGIPDRPLCPEARRTVIRLLAEVDAAGERVAANVAASTGTAGDRCTNLLVDGRAGQDSNLRPRD
jgi:hypothetical protein